MMWVGMPLYICCVCKQKGVGERNQSVNQVRDRVWLCGYFLSAFAFSKGCGQKVILSDLAAHGRPSFVQYNPSRTTRQHALISKIYSKTTPVISLPDAQTIHPITACTHIPSTPQNHPTTVYTSPPSQSQANKAPLPL